MLLQTLQNLRWTCLITPYDWRAAETGTSLLQPAAGGRSVDRNEGVHDGWSEVYLSCLSSAMIFWKNRWTQVAYKS